MKNRRGLSLLAIVALVASVALSAGCPCADVHDKVVRLRRLHIDYRSATVPRSDLDAAKVNELGDTLDATFADLEELTR